MAMHGNSYVLLTPARNEEDFIAKTINSVISQTILPKKWVIISDNSSDRTGEIVQEFASKHDFIHLREAKSAHNRDFSSKVSAFNDGCLQVRDTPFDYIGNLDADVSIEPDYFEALICKFDRNIRLGIAGGWV